MRRHFAIVPATALLLTLGPAAAVGSAPPVSSAPSASIASAAVDPGGKAAAVSKRADRAEAALAEVRDLFGDGARRAGAGSPDRHATMALRDLVLLKGSLSPADRAVAERYLARPTDGVDDPLGDGYTTVEETPVCGAHVCIHYVATTPDAVSPVDVSPDNGIPDFVDVALETLEHVHTTYIAAGYRAPKSDVDSPDPGPSELTDVYLADIGENLYGYCTTDDPNAEPGSDYDFFDMSAYCVLDNDYDAEQFPAHTPTENLQVTAAHEYFHAVQFGYDIAEDTWLLEGTAAWAEDEVYNDVDDNRQYLDESPLSHPAVSLDSTSGLHEYGSWVFFRFLSERFPTAVGGMATIVRDIFRRADGSPTGADQFSAQAIRNTLAARGSKFPAVFSRFGAANRHPGLSYDEGTAYSPAPLLSITGLSRTRLSTGWRSATLNHLANATVRIRPGSTLAASDWRVRLNLDLPSTSRGSAATVQVYLANGSIQVWPITLNTNGDTTKSFRFAVGAVKRVEVTLTNASARFRCWEGTSWSCQGTPLDNRRVFEYRATAYRS